MHQVKPAAVAVAGVFAFLVARALVSGILTAIYWAGVPYSGSYADVVARIGLEGLTGLLDTALPLSVGAFLVFWSLFPIRAELRVMQVVARGAVAVLVGAVLAGVVKVAVLLGTWLAPRAVVGEGLYDVTPIGPGPYDVIFAVVTLSVSGLPLVVLAAVLLWAWLRRDRPTASIGGAFDEV
jgi:hypothetical protein